MSGGQVSSPIVFRGPNGAASRVGAQHSQCYAAWFGSIPGLKVVSPYSAADCKGLLKSAIRDPNPVIFLENEITYGLSFEEEYDEDHIVEIGKAKILREGKDVTIIAFSLVVKYALEAAEILAGEGIEAEVIDLRTIRPIDRETIVNSVKKTSRCVTVEEGFPFASIGSEIASILMEDAFDYLDAPVKKLASVDAPLPYAANLESLALPKTNNIIAAVREICFRS
jgi:pyruvate dehydrogenase E1 component beta subunit